MDAFKKIKFLDNKEIYRGLECNNLKARLQNTGNWWLGIGTFLFVEVQKSFSIPAMVLTRVRLGEGCFDIITIATLYLTMAYKATLGLKEKPEINLVVDTPIQEVNVGVQKFGVILANLVEYIDRIGMMIKIISPVKFFQADPLLFSFTCLIIFLAIGNKLYEQILPSDEKPGVFDRGESYVLKFFKRLPEGWDVFGLTARYLEPLMVGVLGWLITISFSSSVGTVLIISGISLLLSEHQSFQRKKAFQGK